MRAKVSSLPNHAVASLLIPNLSVQLLPQSRKRIQEKSKAT